MRRGPVLLLLAAVAISYGNAWSGAFQFDDYNVIVHNSVVHSWAGFVRDLGHGIRPLLKFTYTWNWTSGLGLPGFHLVNIALHAASSVLLFALARTLFPALSGGAALFAALLFAVHPVQSEAVTYLSGRSVSLMAFFSLASLNLYFTGRDRKCLWAQTLLSPLCYVLAVLSKEVAVILPLALALGQYGREGNERRGLRQAFAGQGVHWAILCSLAVFLALHPGYRQELSACFEIRSLAANGLTQINAVLYLLSHLVLPQALNIDPDLPVITELSWQLAAEGLALLALFGAGCWGVARRQVAGFGILWFFLHLLPTNSLLPRLDVANDRQLYLAAWGLFLALAAGLQTLSAGRGRRLLLVAASLAVITLGGLTMARNRDYQSEVALWEATAKRSPFKARVHHNLGYAYSLARRFGEAEQAYGRALALDPGLEVARVNLERLRRERGKGGY